MNEKAKLFSILDNSSINNSYDFFDNCEDLIASYKVDKYDLLFMDIYIEGSITGIEAINRIRKIDKEVSVAFVTTSQEFALESYRLSAIKYIEKPFSSVDIEEALHLALLKKANAPSLTLRKNGVPEKIPFSHIMYIEQRARQIFIHQISGEESAYYEKLSSLSAQFPEKLFFVPHKSFAVNLSFSKHIDSELICFVMMDDKNIPIRRDTLGKAKKALTDYLFSSTREL